MYGKMGVQFYTRTKTVTQSWKDAEAAGGAIPGLAGVGKCVGGTALCLRRTPDVRMRLPVWASGWPHVCIWLTSCMLCAMPAVPAGASTPGKH